MDIDEYVLASYTPRGFYIELKGHIFSEPSPNGTLTFTPQSFPVFMHEVAHLIQDRATFRGVSEFLDHWDRVAAIAVHVRSRNNSLEIPLVNLESGVSRLAGNINWAVETDRIRQLREPKHEWLSNDRVWAYSRYEVLATESLLAGRRIRCPVTNVHFVDHVAGDEYQHTLGAWEIKEAYSVAVSQIHGGPQLEFGKSSFEYLVVERILTSFFGSVTPQQIVAICHWCLQDLAPGNTLFTLIEHFEIEGLPDSESIYRFARSEALNRGFHINVQSILQDIAEYGRRLGNVEKDLKLLFDWFLEHSSRLLSLHLDDARIFPLDTFLCDANPYDPAEIQNESLKKLFREVEVPLVFWPNGSATSISSDSSVAGSAVLLNRAVFHLSHHLWSSRTAEWKCPMYQTCTLSMKDEHECLKNPWKQLRHFPSCPYGAAAKLMALNESTGLLAQ